MKQPHEYPTVEEIRREKLKRQRAQVIGDLGADLGYPKGMMKQLLAPPRFRNDPVEKRRPLSQETTLRVAARDGYVCYLCGQEPVRPALDHIVPHVAGGSDNPENLAVACQNCNSEKGSKFVSFRVDNREPVFWA